MLVESVTISNLEFCYLFQTYRPWHFWVNTLDAVWQSLVIFYIPCLVYSNTGAGMDELGTTCMNALVFTSLIHIALETKYFVSV